MNTITEEYRFSCYQKIEPLDESGSIWLVRDSLTGRQCAMRRLSMASAKVYDKLLEIHHPNIVEVIEVIHKDGFLYVVEEYLKGRLLSALLTEKRPTRGFALRVARQLLSALGVLHERQIVYRDLKPENIVIDEKGNCKLFDFDIARIYTKEKVCDTSSKGTRDYAPPEQFGFGQTDARSDIYAFGVTLNILATGYFPAQKLCSGQLGSIVGRGDRVIRLSGQMASEEYSALLFTDQERIVFELDQVALQGVTVYAEKTDDGLQLDIRAKSQGKISFSFEDILNENDVWDDAYDVNWQEMSPEYEILLHDMDQNGREDLVIAFSRRKRVETPNPADSYYLTGYVILWVVYWDDENVSMCSEPLYFSDLPTLTADGVLQDNDTSEWIGFRGGRWVY